MHSGSFSESAFVLRELMLGSLLLMLTEESTFIEQHSMLTIVNVLVDAFLCDRTLLSLLHTPLRPTIVKMSSIYTSPLHPTS